MHSDERASTLGRVPPASPVAPEPALLGCRPEDPAVANMIAAVLVKPTVALLWFHVTQTATRGQALFSPVGSCSLQSICSPFPSPSAAPLSPVQVMGSKLWLTT